MGGEMKRLQTSASPATAAAAGQWVPLRRHPVSSPAASLPTEHPTNLLAWNSSASLLYLWDAPKSAPHAPVSIEAAAASKILFPDVRLQISVLNVAMNRAGTCVAICGANGLYVIYLYNRTASGSATCRTGCVGLQLYVGEQNFVHILQVSWHSHRDMHLGVLSVGLIPRPIWRQSVTCIEGNGKALIHELACGLREPVNLLQVRFGVRRAQHLLQIQCSAEQEFYLQPGERGRCHDAVSICPVAFSIGREHLWERFSVSAAQTFS